jgi:hypothetical protein
MKTLTINQDRVVEAASKCPIAATILETLFPEAFVKDSKGFDLRGIECDPLIQRDKLREAGVPPGVEPLQVRLFGNLIYKGFYLSNQLKWEIIKDSEGVEVLVPTKKI